MKMMILALALAIVNQTYSPDSSKVAYTKGNNLFVQDVRTQQETQITFDGSDLILNGYASWVYYEEIFGRPSKYRAFWWSPDSKKLAFYRFDQGGVTEFPIFSPFGQDGSLNLTRYPKAGEQNPSVRIGMVDVSSADIVWADFDQEEDQYFGTPFWGADSRELFVQREPRRQNSLALYRVSAEDGAKRLVYEDAYETWLDWIDGMIFTSKGLYMVRDSKSGWAQIYFLSYDGKECECLTSGRNWDVTLLKCDEKKGNLWFTAKRDSRLHPSAYLLDKKGVITALTDPEYWAKDVTLSADLKTLTATISNAREPWRTISCDARKGWKAGFSDITDPKDAAEPRLSVRTSFDGLRISDDGPFPEIVKIQKDGFDLYALMSLPRDFEPGRRYPVVMQLYGGPGTPYVRDNWKNRDSQDRWCWENGFIYMVVDPRTSGENGREGMDQSFKRMTVVEAQDYITWAKWLQNKDYVKADAIGVEGFSFGGTTTAMLVLRYPQFFRCGIAGGGVYDWTLYDSHYTERFMDTPQENPDGYAEASVLYAVKNGLVSPDYRPGSLMLTHGTGDDNVHFQNTLQLVDALQSAGIQFRLMVYPDGMHGYRGTQKAHSDNMDHEFWINNLL